VLTTSMDSLRSRHTTAIFTLVITDLKAVIWPSCFLGALLSTYESSGWFATTERRGRPRSSRSPYRNLCQVCGP
jgi:hypothetical protein